MSGVILLDNAVIVTAEVEAKGSVLIKDGMICEVLYVSEDFEERKGLLLKEYPETEIVDCGGKWLMAGGIDGHVHFREPGMTHKADMATESKAAAAGGVTTVIDMPNTLPQTVNAEALAAKIEAAKGRCTGKVLFHIGATNGNAEEICSLVRDGAPEKGLKAGDVAGVKIFMGSSTGNMLVNDPSALEKIFSECTHPVLVHCEDEDIIRENLKLAKEKYGSDIPFCEHENIRSRKACVKSSIKALNLAMRHNTRMILCHISTMEELEMVRAAKLHNPGIMAETSCNYLWFSDEDYQRLGSKVKCNPAVKTPADREALREGLRNGTIDLIGSDHAPHLAEEKNNCYEKAPSGIPSIQQTLPVLLTIAAQEDIPLTRIASVFSEKASELYGLNRGKIQKGYCADIVIFDKERKFIVCDEEQFYKCGWTPYCGEELQGTIETVLIDGRFVIRNGRFVA